MRISRPWNYFITAISTASESESYEILLSAALKRSRELDEDEQETNAEVATRIIKEVTASTMDKTIQLKKIKRWNDHRA